MQITKEIKPADVQEGMIILQHGYEWKVNGKTYDPHGNTGNQPRFIITCDAIGQAPIGYVKDMTLGYSVDKFVTVLEPAIQTTLTR